VKHSYFAHKHLLNDHRFRNALHYCQLVQRTAVTFNSFSISVKLFGTVSKPAHTLRFRRHLKTFLLPVLLAHRARLNL